jgi:hypothetical protein
MGSKKVPLDKEIRKILKEEIALLHNETCRTYDNGQYFYEIIDRLEAAKTIGYLAEVLCE